jgi:hypothetical protein
LEKITVPVLSATNWSHHLHTRGGFEGYARISSERKWLEVHGLDHITEFYAGYGVALQKRFFGHFLKGEDTGWETQPPVQLNVRHVDGSFELRPEQEWPLARTQWTRLHLHPGNATLAASPPAVTSSAEFEALGEGLTFTTEPFTEEAEITGPAAARLYTCSTTTDLDLFLTLRVLDPDGQDVTFPSGLDPAGVVGMGWLRASHRATDPERSLPYRPWHPHDHARPLAPGELVRLDIEIWPTSVVIPAGYRLALTVGGRDFEFPSDGPRPAVYGVEMKGNGIFLHTDSHDRPADVFAGTTTLVGGPARPPTCCCPSSPGQLDEYHRAYRPPVPLPWADWECDWRRLAGVARDGLLVRGRRFHHLDGLRHRPHPAMAPLPGPRPFRPDHRHDRLRGHGRRRRRQPPDRPASLPSAPFFSPSALPSPRFRCTSPLSGSLWSPPPWPAPVPAFCSRQPSARVPPSPIRPPGPAFWPSSTSSPTSAWARPPSPSAS